MKPFLQGSNDRARKNSCYMSDQQYLQQSVICRSLPVINCELPLP